jgi:hypothetical protein
MRHCVVGLVLVCLLGCPARADVLALWNFNDAAAGTEFGYLVDRGAGTMTSDFPVSNVASTTGTPVNSQDEDPAGLALRLSHYANNGRSLTWMVNTGGFESLAVSFATQRTGTGFGSNQFQYTMDAGTNWISFGDLFNSSTSGFVLQSYNLAGISDITDNPGAGFRIVLGGATSSSGNIRFDNVLVTGDPMSEPPPPAPVPEPSTLTLMFAGLAAAGKFLAGARNRMG